MGWYLYLIAGVVVILALLVGRLRSGNTIRTRNISGIVVGGDNTGPVSQVNAPQARPEPRPDRVAWAIAVVGVAIAAAQLSHDLWFK